MDPPRLEPPDEIPVIRPELTRPAPAPAAPARPSASRLGVLLALGALLVLGAAVLFVLPDIVADREGPTTETRPAAPPPERAPVADADTGGTGGRASSVPAAAEVDAGASAAAKAEAEAVLAEVLGRKAVLESERVITWAPVDYPAALERLREADGHFREGAFERARDGYGAVLEQLGALDASRPRRLEAALAAGAAALDAGDGASAAMQFAIALALEPGSEAAAVGARRAETIEEVLALVGTDLEQEDAGELDAARATFAEAAALDPLALPATEGLARVQAAIVERDFAAAMSAALDALGAGRLAEAGRALREADGLKPGSPAVRDARARLAAADQLRRIDGHRRAAEGFAADERWSEAAAAYAKALAIDGALAFAIAGKAEAEAMARLHGTLDGLVADPGRLAERELLEQARQVLDDARGIADGGPQLRGKVTRLDAMVRTASQPVQVLLVSDGLTEVTVYRVGRLGTFESRELTLRPGSYVAVGARAGFRDVRRNFSVVGGRQGPPVVIRCEERI